MVKLKYQFICSWLYNLCWVQLVVLLLVSAENTHVVASSSKSTGAEWAKMASFLCLAVSWSCWLGGASFLSLWPLQHISLGFLHGSNGVPRSQDPMYKCLSNLFSCNIYWYAICQNHMAKSSQYRQYTKAWILRRVIN